MLSIYPVGYTEWHVTKQLIGSMLQFNDIWLLEAIA